MKIGLLTQRLLKALFHFFYNNAEKNTFTQYRKGLAAITVLLILANNTHAQSWTNAIDIGSPANEYGQAVCTDPAGNMYFTGRFLNTVNFNPGGTAVNLASAGSSDVYIAKYNAAGVFQWAVSAGGIGTDFGDGLVCDGTNLYVVGAFANSATFGTTTLTSNGGQDIFVAQVNAATGVINWAANYGGAGDDNGWGICLDGSGNVYITGNYFNTATFGATTLTVNGGATSNTNDILVAQLNPANGAVVWATGGGAASADDAPASSGISYNAMMNEIVVATGIGTTPSQIATFGTLAPITTVGNGDGCVLELNPTTGAFMNELSFGSVGNGTTSCFGSCYDANSMDVFVTGTYNSNPSASQSITLPGTAALPATVNDAVFVARYSVLNHNFVWAQAGTVSGTDNINTAGFSIAADNAGGIYVTGDFANTLTMGTGSITSAGLGNVFVAKYTAAMGTFGYLLQGNGNNPTFNNEGFGIACSNAGGLAVTGADASTCAFGTYTLTSNGLQDIFNAFATVPVYAAPTIAISGSYSVCENGTIASLPYGNTTGNPTAYSIIWDAAALAAGLTNVTNAPLPVGSFTIAVPSGFTGGPYVGSFIVNNDTASGEVQTFGVTFNPAPTFTSPLTVPSMCSNTAFTYTITSSTPGVVFSWDRASTAGVSGAPLSDTGAIINEVLSNTTNDSISVIYIDSLKSLGCVVTQSVSVTVYPLPVVNSSLATGNICTGEVFSRSQSTSIPGATITWTNITSGGSGTGSISQTLTNSGVTPITVTYDDRITAYGCTNTESFNVVVNAIPQLSSSTSLSPLCSGAEFFYDATSYDAGVSFSWSRAAVSGITPSSNSGSGNTISETLTNTTTSDINVIYDIRMSVNGCSGNEYLSLTVDPYPQAPVITTMPPSSVCEGTDYQNFGSATPPPTGVTYTWSVVNAFTWAVGQGGQYSLISFPYSGNAMVILSADYSGGCNNSDTVNITVGNTEAPSISVIYYNSSLICLPYNMDSYQWGYDDATTLDSTLLPGEINQDYYNPSLDPTKYYWVIATEGSCFQKAYYITPSAVSNLNATETALKVYPNPAQDLLNVEVKGAGAGNNSMIELLDVSGKVLQKVNLSGANTSINVSELPSGYYLISCFHEGVKMATTQFIKD